MLNSENGDRFQANGGFKMIFCNILVFINTSVHFIRTLVTHPVNRQIMQWETKGSPRPKKRICHDHRSKPTITNRRVVSSPIFTRFGTFWFLILLKMEIAIKLCQFSHLSYIQVHVARIVKSILEDDQKYFGSGSSKGSTLIVIINS